MNDLELAEEIERHISYRPSGFVIPPYQLYEADAKQIIAALRRGHERPPSGEMVMVPREPTKAMLEAAGSINGYDPERETADADHIVWWKDMLSAAEAEGRKS